MARYIDADAVDFSPLKNDFDRARAKVIIMGQPTADVVPVVRCEKCEYGNKHTDCHGRKYYGCDINIDIGEVREVEPTHYCSYGKRRSNDD